MSKIFSLDSSVIYHKISLLYMPEYGKGLITKNYGSK